MVQWDDGLSRHYNEYITELQFSCIAKKGAFLSLAKIEITQFFQLRTFEELFALLKNN